MYAQGVNLADGQQVELWGEGLPNIDEHVRARMLNRVVPAKGKHRMVGQIAIWKQRLNANGHIEDDHEAG